MKRYLLAAGLLFGGLALVLAQISILPPSSLVTSSDLIDLPHAVTPSPANPTGYISRRATVDQLPGSGGGVVNMIDYGADPTATVDSCGLALAKALSVLAALPTGGVLYWPRGYYLCNERIASTNKPIAIIGDGAGVTYLLFSNATAGQAGISISQNTGVFQTIISGLQIQTNVDQPNNNGITVAYSNTSTLKPTISFTDLIINGNDNNQHYWKNGIYCSGCVFGSIQRATIVGKEEGSPATGISASNMNAGIHLNGQGLPANTEASTDVRISATVVSLAKYGTYMSGDSEGAHMVGVTMFGVNYGIYHDDYAGSHDPTARPNMPAAFINGMDCATYFACVVVKGWNAPVIRGTQLAKRPEGNGNWDAVELLDGVYQGPITAGTAGGLVSGNQSVGMSFGQSPGGISKHVVLGPNSVGNFITGELAEWDDYFADLGSGTSTNMITNNSQLPTNGLARAWFTGTNPNTITAGNFPITTPADLGIVSLPNADATPSVGSRAAQSFILANPTAQSITNFLNGYIGQTITIVAGTANNAIVNNYNNSRGRIYLVPGVDWTMTAGSTLTLRMENGTPPYWREIARRRAPG
jgi:hypothetical protein